MTPGDLEFARHSTSCSGSSKPPSTPALPHLAAAETDVADVFAELGVTEMWRHHTGHGSAQGHEAPFIDNDETAENRPPRARPLRPRPRRSSTLRHRSQTARTVERLTYYPRDLRAWSSRPDACAVLRSRSPRSPPRSRPPLGLRGSMRRGRTGRRPRKRAAPRPVAPVSAQPPGVGAHLAHVSGGTAGERHASLTTSIVTGTIWCEGRGPVPALRCPDPCRAGHDPSAGCRGPRANGRGQAAPRRRL